MFIFKADQICYSVLCVFSYIAAGQEQRKTPQHKGSHGSQQSQQHSTHAKHQTGHHQQQQQSSSHSPNKQTHLPSQIKPQTVTIAPTVQPQKPAVTVATVQPQTIVSQSTPPNATKQQPQQQQPQQQQNAPSVPAATKRPSIPDASVTNLPQLPPRVQSQTSVTARGPPPAIPPRQNIPPPMRSSSIQVTSVTPVQRPALARQVSANSIPPQCTPQPPPKFVIPQRQNSRTSMGRTGSISGPSGGGGGGAPVGRTGSISGPSGGSSATGSSGSGSPQSQRKH